MFFEPPMLAICWLAALIATATERLGETVLPVLHEIGQGISCFGRGKKRKVALNESR